MKKIAAMLCVFLLLTGCSGNDAQLERAMDFRAKLLAQAVSFDAEITADYGDKTYTFAMHCESDTKGDMTFTVTAPESIAGISGTISASGGKLTFSDTALAFDLMADDQLSPVSAPWILMKTLRSGYLTSCGSEGEMLRVAIDDSYEADALHLDIWLDKNDVPSVSEIYWQGRRLLSIIVTNFTFL